MFETQSRTLGGFGGRKALRAAIWAALVVYGVYLSGSAMAEPVSTDLQPAYGPLGLAEMGKLDPLGGAEREKTMVFERPTKADPREEIACLALNIYFEARGEPDQGKFAVGHVVLNRVASGRFPDTICGVVQQGGEVRRYRCQFSWWCDGRSDKPRNQRDWELSNEVALNVYWGLTVDPTEGALWYHADYVSPAWRNDFEAGPKIGRHLFYRAADRGARVASRRISN